MKKPISLEKCREVIYFLGTPSRFVDQLSGQNEGGVLWPPESIHTIAYFYIYISIR